jgi:hypothetical protein
VAGRIAGIALLNPGDAGRLKARVRLLTVQRRSYHTH